MKALEKPVVVVGSGNAEHVLHLGKDLELDQKYEVDSYEVFGGSGVNYTLRLLNARLPVFPVLSLGADDLGKRIRSEIRSAARKAGASDIVRAYLSSDDFLNQYLRTQRAVILVEGARRTIFADKMHTGAKHFFSQMKRALHRYQESFSSENASIMIGHIHSDHPRCCSKIPGECARYVIESFSPANAIYCNFGAGQIYMGADYWEEDLKKVSLFQLNLREIKKFFSKKSDAPRLSEILNWFKERNITVVITLDKFGSIASYKDGGEGVIVSWPREYPGFIDPTGAGDAFFSGLVYQLHNNLDFSFFDFYHAIETATIWATYACGHFGGSSNCPDPATIEKFQNELYFPGEGSQILTMKEADLIIRVFDRMT